MRVILSRKGFDSGYGGCASPILPDGTMISMPIPDSTGNCRYNDLIAPDGKRYSEIWKDLLQKDSYEERCHLDPDIRGNIRIQPENWRPAFGQTGAAQSHLENNGVKIGDIFLFFGWFRKTEYINGKLLYVKDAPDIHAIYGYLQIGEILKGFDVKKCPWHPHSENSHIYSKYNQLTNNTIYVASKSLMIDGNDTGLTGSGILQFSEKRVLTLPNAITRTQWKLNDMFENIPITYHTKNNIKNGYFQSAKRGQEFIFDENPAVVDWVKTLLFI